MQNLVPLAAGAVEVRRSRWLPLEQVPIRVLGRRVAAAEVRFLGLDRTGARLTGAFAVELWCLPRSSERSLVLRATAPWQATVPFRPNMPEVCGGRLRPAVVFTRLLCTAARPALRRGRPGVWFQVCGRVWVMARAEWPAAAPFFRSLTSELNPAAPPLADLLAELRQAVVDRTARIRVGGFLAEEGGALGWLSARPAPPVAGRPPLVSVTGATEAEVAGRIQADEVAGRVRADEVVRGGKRACWARLHLVLRTAGGGDPADAVVRLWPLDTEGRAGGPGARPVVECRWQGATAWTLPPGRYRLEVLAPDRTRSLQHIDLVPGAARRLDVGLPSPAPARDRAVTGGERRPSGRRSGAAAARE
ncbi:MAG: hypothetical protein IRY95_00240 [Clostridia bacterium]|nr:hypothetical protein [Clostridia bacterium]